LNGLDSLLSIAQMPGGIPVACVAVGSGGARNAALLAVAILALSDSAVARKLLQYRKDQSGKVKESILEAAKSRKNPPEIYI
jgi:5-(carboxyamino)imidazole ribonucleotide mutase